MPAHRSYTDKQNARIRGTVVQLVERFGSQRRLAEALGITQPALSAFLLNKYGISPTLARKIAELAGISEAALIGDAEAPAVAKDEFPNRAVVVEFARRAGFPDVVVDRLRHTRPSASFDPPSTEWATLLVLYLQEERGPFQVLPSTRARRSEK